MHEGYRNQCSATKLQPSSKLHFSPILHDNSISGKLNKGKEDHLLVLTPVSRSIRSQMFFKIGILKNFDLVFFNKVTGKAIDCKNLKQSF